MSKESLSNDYSEHIDTHHHSPLLIRLQALIESTRFQHFITAVIIINAITLGLETSEAAMASYGSVLVALDHVALSIFVVEMALKLVAYGWRFFTRGWNIFDFLIIGLSLTPATGNLSVLRALRSIRVLRLLSVMPRLRVVIQALLEAIPGMASILAVMLLIFYVGAVLATKMFGGTFPEWFGGLDRSLYSLFQIMTLESWSMGIVRPVMEEYPWAWAFFVPFIIVTSFAVLNLFIAILVSSIQEQADMEHRAEMEDLHVIVHAEAEQLSGKIAKLHQENRLIHQEITALRDVLLHRQQE